MRLSVGPAIDQTDAMTGSCLGHGKNELVLEVLRDSGVQVYTGAVELVKALRAQGTPVAVVSASENTQAALEAGGIAHLFDARIDGRVVKAHGLAGKPAPDSYLEGAKALGVRADRAVVVEDALAGVEAGRAGHFGLVIGVDHHDHADELRAHGADVVVTDLGELLDPDTSG